MKKHYFNVLVEEKEFIALLIENESENKPFYQIKIIEGSNFLCEEEYLKIILMEIALTYVGEGVHSEKIGQEDVEITYSIEK